MRFSLYATSEITPKTGVVQVITTGGIYKRDDKSEYIENCLVHGYKYKGNRVVKYKVPIHMSRLNIISLYSPLNEFLDYISLEALVYDQRQHKTK